MPKDSKANKALWDQKTYTTAQACKIVNCGLSYVKSLNRPERQKEPIFKPTYPAETSGKSNYFTELDVLKMAVLYEASLSKVSQKHFKSILSEIDALLPTDWRIWSKLPKPTISLLTSKGINIVIDIAFIQSELLEKINEI